jgi:hypothetical protein
MNAHSTGAPEKEFHIFVGTRGQLHLSDPEKNRNTAQGKKRESGTLFWAGFLIASPV